MLPNEPDPGFEPGFEPIFSRTGELFFARLLEKRIPAPRSGALENLGRSLMGLGCQIRGRGGAPRSSTGKTKVVENLEISL
jgi:hypothetical protein